MSNDIFDYLKIAFIGGAVLLAIAFMGQDHKGTTQNRSPVVTEDSTANKKIVKAYTACVDYKGEKTDIESAYCNFIQLKMKELNNRVNVQKKAELDDTLKAAMDVIAP